MAYSIFKYFISTLSVNILTLIILSATWTFNEYKGISHTI